MSLAVLFGPLSPADAARLVLYAERHGWSGRVSGSLEEREEFARQLSEGARKIHIPHGRQPKPRSKRQKGAR